MSTTDLPAEVKSENWLTAHNNNLANLYSISQCMTLCDIGGDHENCLVVADLTDQRKRQKKQMKLKVFKGVSIIKETNIIDLPTGVVGFFLDQNEPRTPALAVASGPYIYVYKNMKPYFKCTLPLMDVDQDEESLWKEFREGKITATQLRGSLENLRNAGCSLTVQSVKTTTVAMDKLEEFAQMFMGTHLKRQTVATCLSTIKKAHNEPDAISCIIVGTEANQLLVIDPEAFTVLFALNLESAPVFICAMGLYDVEFRIYVACRNGCIYVGKRGTSVPRKLVYLNTQPLGMLRSGKTLIVGCMDETLRCISPKGREIWRKSLPASLITMCAFETEQHQQQQHNTTNLTTGVICALSDSTINIYRDRDLIETISMNDIVTGLLFGPFGREQQALLIITRSGSLVIKLLKRTASLKSNESYRGPPPAQFEKLNIPKKTKLFIDQAFRERENAVAIHRKFAQDLAQLRLISARNYLQLLQSHNNPLAHTTTTTGPNGDSCPALRLSVQVNGIGPLFSMKVILATIDSKQPATNLIMTFVYDTKIYSMEKNIIHIPYMVPATSYTFSVYVECVNDKGVADTIKVLIIKAQSNDPIVTGLVNMPVSESFLNS